MKKYLIAAALLLALCLSACGAKSEIIEDSNDSGMSFKLTNISGGFAREMELEEGDNVAFEITVTGGTLDIVLKKSGSEPVYRGNDARTGSFTVVIPESGIYSLSIAGKNASGSISIQK